MRKCPKCGCGTKEPNYCPVCRYKEKAVGAICGDGMCPYVPCINYPKCNHREAEKG